MQINDKHSHCFVIAAQRIMRFICETISTRVKNAFLLYFDGFVPDFTSPEMRILKRFIICIELLIKYYKMLTHASKPIFSLFLVNFNILN